MFNKFTTPAALGASVLAWGGPALAQAGEGYGYHHGWGGGGGMWGGWGGGMIVGPLLMLLFIAAATAVVVLVVRAISRGSGHDGYRHKHGPNAGTDALAVLEERYAKGEIDTNEFNERKKALRGE